MSQFGIANFSQFMEALKRDEKLVQDLSEPLREIGLDWMRGNKGLFSYSGAGPWADLSGPKESRDKKGHLRRSRGYKAEKLKRWGFVYPVLRASGRLEQSLTEPGAPGSSLEVQDGKTVVVGTLLTGKGGAPYPAFLQSGTYKMPARPFLTVLPGATSRWKLILQKYVISGIRPQSRS